MSAKFDLERRAAEIQEKLYGSFERTRTDAMLQLARELAEAIAAECSRQSEHYAPTSQGIGFRDAMQSAANIARSFARPRSREEIFREALEKVRDALRDYEFPPERLVESIQRALDEGAKVRP